MSILKILIIEDNLIQAQELEEQLLDFGYLITDNVSNSNDAIKAFRRKIPDLVICDIKLEDSPKDGIEIANELNRLEKVPIIFLTAQVGTHFEERASEVEPAYYLIKPCHEAQLQIAINIALRNFTKKMKANIYHSLSKSNEPNDQVFLKENHFFIKEKDRHRRIDINDILWIEADGVYSMIITDGYKLTVTINLSKLLEQLNSLHLLRIHRSHAISLNKIDYFDKDSVFITYQEKEKQLTVSKTYKEVFQATLHRLKSN